MTEPFPTADAVIQPGREPVCRACDRPINDEPAFNGCASGDPAHVMWECPDCGRRVVELVEEVTRDG